MDCVPGAGHWAQSHWQQFLEEGASVLVLQVRVQELVQFAGGPQLLRQSGSEGPVLACSHHAMCARKSGSRPRPPPVPCPRALSAGPPAGVHPRSGYLQTPQSQDLDRCCARRQTEGKRTGPEPMGLTSGQGGKGGLCQAPRAPHTLPFFTRPCVFSF